MKFIITLVLALVFQIFSHAAAPGTQAFNTNQFDVTGNRVALKDGLVVTNLTLTGAGAGNLFEVYNESNELKFWVDDNGFSYPQLWTNNAGTIQASSTVVAGADSVGFKLDSLNTLTANDDIVQFLNHGTRYAGISYNGEIYSGNRSTNFAWMRYDPIFQQSEFQGVITNGAFHWIQNLNQYASGTNVVQTFSFTRDVQTIMLLDPSGDFGLTARYIYDTSDTVSSGNLVEYRNNGTNKFVVPWDGAVQIPGDATANSLTITNELNVHGSIKANTLIVTNNVQFYNNTYVSNIYITNILTAAGSSVFNTFTANSGTVSNSLTLQGGANITSGNLTNSGTYVGTIDGAATGTTLKQIKSLKLQFPRLVDGAGCTYANTNDYTALTFMLPQFSGSAAASANYCDFAFRVPMDLDTSVDLTASLTIRLGAADTSAQAYDVGMVSIANSSPAAGTPANFVTLTVGADASGASGDIEGVSAVTLTSWKSNLTAGQWCLLRLRRDGTDASTQVSNLMELEIFYTSTQ